MMIVDKAPYSAVTWQCKCMTRQGVPYWADYPADVNAKLEEARTNGHNVVSWWWQLAKDVPPVEYEIFPFDMYQQNVKTRKIRTIRRIQVEGSEAEAVVVRTVQ